MASLLIGWKAPKHGCESRALDLLVESLEYCKSQMRNGTVDFFEPILLPHEDGSLRGFVIVRSSRGKLEALRNSGSFMSIMARGIDLLDDFGIVEAYHGQDLHTRLTRWSNWLPARRM